jgi:hypothetical protein
LLKSLLLINDARVCQKESENYTPVPYALMVSGPSVVVKKNFKIRF